MLQRTFILRSVQLFSAFPGKVLATIAPFFEEVTVAAGETVFHKDEIGKSMYIIVHGQVCVHQGESIVVLLKDREVFGELSILSPERRMASVTALEETHLLRLDQDILYELMAENVEIARYLIEVLVERYRA